MQTLGNIAQRNALCLVVKEYLLEAQGRAFVVKEYVGLEIILKRAEIDIGRAAGGQGVVANQQFGMQETCLVEIDAGTSPVQFAEVGA